MTAIGRAQWPETWAETRTWATSGWDWDGSDDDGDYWVQPFESGDRIVIIRYFVPTGETNDDDSDEWYYRHICSMREEILEESE